MVDDLDQLGKVLRAKVIILVKVWCLPDSPKPVSPKPDSPKPNSPKPVSPKPDSPKLGVRVRVRARLGFRVRV